ncbi:MAG: hypothetical protein ACYTF0_05970, partial [Planctomycetota bacterium]
MLTSLTPHHRSLAISSIVGGLALALLVGSWATLTFDPALITYAGGSWLCLVATVYRLALWAQRPPTWRYLVGGTKALLTPRGALARHRYVGARLTSYLASNAFIAARAKLRWGAHWPIMIGCLMALSIVVPLVCGWMHFELVPNPSHEGGLMPPSSIGADLTRTAPVAPRELPPSSTTAAIAAEQLAHYQMAVYGIPTITFA